MSSRDNPWKAIPARRLSQYQVNLRVYAILLLLSFAALSGPAALLLARSGSDDAGAVAEGVADPVLLLAVQAASEFALGLSTSVVAAEGVDVAFGSDLGGIDPLGFLPSQRRSLVDGVAHADVVERVSGRYLGGREYEMVTVKIVGESGGHVLLTVPVFVEGPALAAGISILPSPQGGRTRTTALDYSDHPQRVSASGQLRRVTGEWASAWASGDAALLKRLTGDSQPGSYLPLGGFRLEQYDIISVIDLSEQVSRNEERSFQAVRVSLLMTPGSGSVSPFRVEYDLRVDNPYSDFPLITAWGPPGSSPLTPFENRIG